jgi:Cdc6-like AAA superfamily ATPase
MLPPEPKIFHGRDSELSDILKLFHQNHPRIAVLGTGGMGKTSLAQAAVHHTEIAAQYGQLRFFVACDSIATTIELAALIGTHLGLKSGKDPTRPVVEHLSHSPPTLLILDNFETVWEPTESRGDIEEFLSLITNVEHLALMVGAESLACTPLTYCRSQCEELKDQLRSPGVDHFCSPWHLWSMRLPCKHFLKSLTTVLIKKKLKKSCS